VCVLTCDSSTVAHVNAVSSASASNSGRPFAGPTTNPTTQATIVTAKKRRRSSTPWTRGSCTNPIAAATPIATIATPADSSRVGKRSMSTSPTAIASTQNAKPAHPGP